MTKRIPLPALALAAGLAVSPAVSAQEGVLPERALGDPDAPVEVIEYASLSCNHCANFHVDSFPEIRERFVDTGMVRFVYRDFPLNQSALIGSMIAQCQEGDRFFPVLDALFRRQADWAFEEDPEAQKAAAGKFLRQLGIGKDDLAACFEESPENEARLEAILAGRIDARDRLDVDSTPTFFVDGEKVEGGLDADRLAELIGQ